MEAISVYNNSNSWDRPPTRGYDLRCHWLFGECTFFFVTVQTRYLLFIFFISKSTVLQKQYVFLWFSGLSVKFVGTNPMFIKIFFGFNANVPVILLFDKHSQGSCLVLWIHDIIQLHKDEGFDFSLHHHLIIKHILRARIDPTPRPLPSLETVTLSQDTQWIFPFSLFPP